MIIELFKISHFKRAAALTGMTLLLSNCVGNVDDPGANTNAPYDDEEGGDVEQQGQAATATYPLLATSSRGGSPVWDACYGKSDSTPTIVDPRSLVQPGISDGKNVVFNAFYKDCHTDPTAVQEVGHAKTCGELRARFAQGANLLDTGSKGVAALFAGNTPTSWASLGGISSFTAAQYNGVWAVWGGFFTRPSNFDELVSERYGSPIDNRNPSVNPNPYPKPGEDPNKTNGGTGRLPEMFTQFRGADGKWSGRIGITCHACHSGQAGTNYIQGGGSSLADLNLFLRDMLARGYPASLATIANLNHTRGTNNASDINLAFVFPNNSLISSEVLGLITSGSTAGMDTPAWWNMGHRPVKFVDGTFPIDAPRVDMVFYTPFLGLFGQLGSLLAPEGQKWMRDNGPPANTWIETLKAPAYPLTVDTTLAETGAALFHTLNMWDPARNNTVPKPPAGNGSCASCHGAYSPRYTNDPAFLATPALAGVASYIVPQKIIGTDPVRWQTNNQAVQRAGADNFFGYPTTKGTANDCGPQNQNRLRGDREDGYLAPPLFGVWATAPYFHNGSVPNVWEVLKPADRKPIWRRISKPKPTGQSGVIMGYDTDLTRAYDSTKMGWKYDTIACQWRSLLNPAVTPYISCDPNDEYNDPLVQQILNPLFANLILTWNILFPPILSNRDMEDRKIYNTNLFAQGNEGHEFNSVLTDLERTAIIEYLKTL